MRFSAKRSAYSDMPSVSSHSAICCSGRTPVLEQQDNYHYVNSSSNFFASVRSRVSNPSVNQP
jgi:hypothetical protein